MQIVISPCLTEKFMLWISVKIQCHTDNTSAKPGAEAAFEEMVLFL